MRRSAQGQDPLPFETCRDHCDDWTARELGIDESQLCEGHCFNSLRSDYRRRLIEVGTFELADYSNAVPIPALAPIIASAQFDRAESVRFEELGRFVATKYWRIGGFGASDPELVSEFRRKHSIPIFQTVLVRGEGKDSKQEALWAACLRKGYFASIKALNDAVFVAPNFSVYTDRTQCQFHQRYNLARSIRFGAILNALQLPTVPSIACAGKRDRERIADWLERQGNRITHIAVNAQMRGSTLQQNLTDIREIERLTGRKWHWLIFGPCRAEQFSLTFQTVEPDRASFVTSTVFQKHGAKEDLFGHKLGGSSADDRLRLILAQLQAEYELARQSPTVRKRRSRK